MCFSLKPCCFVSLFHDSVAAAQHIIGNRVASLAHAACYTVLYSYRPAFVPEKKQYLLSTATSFAAPSQRRSHHRHPHCHCTERLPFPLGHMPPLILVPKASAEHVMQNHQASLGHQVLESAIRSRLSLRDSVPRFNLCTHNRKQT